METPPYAVGDLVSLARWDEHEPPWKRLGTCYVRAVEWRGSRCESGWMVTVQEPYRPDRRRMPRRMTLDANWLAPAEADR